MGGVGFALRTNFIGASNGGVWKSKTVSIAIEPASASRANAPSRVTAVAADPSDPSGDRWIGDPHETTGDGRNRVDAAAGQRRIVDPQTGDAGSTPGQAATYAPLTDGMLITRGMAAPPPSGAAADVPPPADYDADGFKISESDSPRPTDRKAVTDDPKRGGPASYDAGTVNDPGSSL